MSASLRSWFEEQGYFLYEVVNIGNREWSDTSPEEYARPTKAYPDTPEPKCPDMSLWNFSGTPFKSIEDPTPLSIEDPFPYAFMGPRLREDEEDRPPYSTVQKLFVRFLSRFCISDLG